MANTNRSKFELLLDRFEPGIRAGFLGAFDSIKSRVTLKLLVERLEKGDIEGAIDLLQIERAAFSGLEVAIAQAYNGGGIAFAEDMRLRDPDGNRMQFNFGVRNLVAEQRLAAHSASLVTRVTAEQIDMLRQSLAEGLARGDNPTRTALDMVGRRSRVSGKREGGYLGLSGPQERTSAKARSALISGDPRAMREYKTLKLRDHRFDAMVDKAIAEGRPLPLADVTRVISRLNDRQLKYRADVIGLNETFDALALAKDEAMRQAIESGKVDVRFVRKKWKHSSKANPRHQHLQMNNVEVPYSEDFVMPDGTRIPFPHAPGIPASHSVGCGCFHELRIDFTAQLIERRRAA